MNIQMVDLVGQYQKIKPEIDAAIKEVLDSGQFILGKQVAEFEGAAAKYLGVKHAVGSASGTEALQIAMMALGIGLGDEVITTPFTFVATAETIVLLGAKPVYVDIDAKTYNLDVTQIEKVITKKTKAIIPVHLYGQACDMEPLLDIGGKHGIPIIEDAAQAIGAEYKGKKVASFGTFGCISFFPSKNLGAYGDAGMVVTNDDALAEKARMITIHGSKVKYKHECLGLNSRLDTIQAAILKVKLKYLDQWIQARRGAAMKYNALFKEKNILTPYEASYGKHVYHQYTLRLKNRDAVAEHLAAKKIPHAIYYPIPLHLQEAFKHVGSPKGSFPITEQAAAEVLSLPMHTELTDQQQTFIANSVLEAI